MRSGRDRRRRLLHLQPPRRRPRRRHAGRRLLPRIRAALVMALVMSAAGIHAAGVCNSPDETLDRAARQPGRVSWRRPTCSSRCSTGCSIPGRRRLVLLPTPATRTPCGFRRAGEPERLEATSPPLGLAAREQHRAPRRVVPWSDGRRPALPLHRRTGRCARPGGDGFGEATGCSQGIASRRDHPPEAIVAARLHRGRAFAPHPATISPCSSSGSDGVSRPKGGSASTSSGTRASSDRIAQARRRHRPRTPSSRSGPGPGGLTAALLPYAGRPSDRDREGPRI